LALVLATSVIPDLRKKASGSDSKVAQAKTRLLAAQRQSQTVASLADSPVALLPLDEGFAKRVSAIRAGAPQFGLHLQAVQGITGPGQASMQLAGVREHLVLKVPVIEFQIQGTYLALSGLLAFASEHLGPSQGILINQVTLERDTYLIRLAMFGKK
jgi:hypothetical protein